MALRSTPPDLRQFLPELPAKIGFSFRHYLGELLAEQKAGMKHGKWLPWIQENLPFSERTARDYMRFYDRREELKTARVADMAEARKFLEVPKQHAFKQGMSLLERMKITLPSTKFRVLHADPPYYDEFTIEELKTILVKECADRDSVLFIWATNHQEDFPRMFELIETWGFQYRTSYYWSWVEDPPEGSEKRPRIVKDVTWEAVPFLLRTVVEPCFIATRGQHNIPPRNRMVEGLGKYQKGKSTREDWIRQILEYQFYDRTKLEIFPKKKHEGWEAWGVIEEPVV